MSFLDEWQVDANGIVSPCEDVFAWLRTLTRDEYERRFRVGNVRIGKSRISTVFLTSCATPGCHWETMVFGGPCNGDQLRYATLADARKGHKWMIDHVIRTRRRLRPRTKR